MGKKSTAIAKPETTSLGSADANEDLLASILDVDVPDGLDELDKDDLQVPLKVWNLKGKSNSGVQHRQDQFFDTLTEEVTSKIDAVFLVLHKSNEWREWSDKEKRSLIHCRSNDRVTGTPEEGGTRKCEGCQYAEWSMVDGRRQRRCKTTYNLIGVEQLTRKPFIMRFRNSAIPSLKKHLNRHFLGKRVVKGQRRNYPLFAFISTVTLEMHEDGNYAVPVFTRGPVLDRESIQDAVEEMTYFREVILPELDKYADADNVSADEAPQSRTDASDFSDAEDAELVDVPPVEMPEGRTL